MKRSEKKRVLAVLGAGRQGTAAAYDFLKFGNAEQVILADFSLEAADRAAGKLAELLPESAGKVTTRRVDASDVVEVQQFLEPVHTLLSAVPYHMHPLVAEAAIVSHANMCDLGGNTGVAFRVLALDRRAKEAGITLIPDCGLAPGMVNTLAVYGMEHMDSCSDIQLRCGGLPQNPRPPLDYRLEFAISGLTVEYFGKADVLRGGKLKQVDTFTELEQIEIPGLGRCEAFVTSGGASTAPYTFEDKVQNYEYKTIRYPGHYDKFKVIKELGLLELEPVKVGNVEVVPREVFHACAGPRLTFADDKDLVAVRAVCRGEKAGKAITVEIDILDRHDEATGFSAMERTTGFSAAIVCELVAQGKVEPGAHALEKVIPGKPFVEALRARGIPVEESISS